MVNNTQTDILCHHGILGQKWGVRRYQNPDGSLTDAGRKRYLSPRGGFTGEGYKEFARRASASSLREKTIPAGTRVYRIMGKGENLKDGVYVYRDVDKYNLRSITPWLSQKRGVTPSSLEERTYTTNREIKIPSQDLVTKESIDILSKNKKIADYSMMALAFSRAGSPGADQKIYEKMIGKDQKGIEKVFLDSIDKTVQDKTGKKLSDLSPENQMYWFTAAKSASEDMHYGLKYIESAFSKRVSEGTNTDNYDRKLVNKLLTDAIGSSDEFRSKLMARLSKQGYSGMYDNNMIAFDTGYAQEAHDPIIIFDPKALDYKTATPMSEAKVAVANIEYDKYRRALAKNN